MQVLLTDCNVATLENTRSYFEQRGHVAEIAASGLGCLSVLRAFSPDVLVLDCELTWGGSEGVLEVMRRSHWRSIPVILTGRKSDFPVRLESPLVDWLEKPFCPAELLDSALAAVKTTGGTVVTTFRQPCPVCGRSVQVPVAWLGKWISCGHCLAMFLGRDSIGARVGRRSSTPAFASN